MNLANVELLNFIDKSKVADTHPAITIQRIVTIPSDNDEGLELRKVFSLTQRHWKIFDLLVDAHAVEIGSLLKVVERYQKVKPSPFDQALEFCLDAIDSVFDVRNNKDMERLSKAWDKGDQDDSWHRFAENVTKTLH